MGYNVHDVLTKFVVYITLILFLIWFEIIIIFQDET
jgi:hypothetical protein